VEFDRLLGGRVVLGSELAKGGEGKVFEVAGQPGVVAKVFHSPSSAVEQRLRAMLAIRPEGMRESGTGLVVLAWPEDLLMVDGSVVGFLMPKIDTSDAAEIHQITNPSARFDPRDPPVWTGGFTWRYLLSSAKNLANAVRVCHDAEIVIGDFNERNILVESTSRVTLVDCDSMQVRDPDSGDAFMCRVARAEFLAPELHGVDLDRRVRQPLSDLFGLAVHIHMLLLEGTHPFRGIWNGSGEPPLSDQNAYRGDWNYRSGGDLKPPRRAPDISVIPDELVALFERAFVDGARSPRSRPSALEWRDALVEVESALTTCDLNGQHVYRSGLGECPWCDRNSTLTAAAAPIKQTSLPTPAPQSRS